MLISNAPTVNFPSADHLKRRLSSEFASAGENSQINVEHLIDLCGYMLGDAQLTEEALIQLGSRTLATITDSSAHQLARKVFTAAAACGQYTPIAFRSATMA